MAETSTVCPVRKVRSPVEALNGGVVADEAGVEQDQKPSSS
jgi:hypothetical protein